MRGRLNARNRAGPPAGSPPSAPPTPVGRRSRTPPGFTILWTTVAVDLVGFGMVLPILPLYAKRFGASPARSGS